MDERLAWLVPCLKALFMLNFLERPNRLRSHRMNRLIWSLLALTLLAAPLPASAQAAATASEVRLNLSAFGEIRAAPDMAQITLAVETTDPTAAQAMASNRERMAKVFAALAQQGINSHDIQTTGLNLSVQYDYSKSLPSKRPVYQATNSVTITVNDLGRLGASLDAVVAAGVNQISGISLGLKNPQAIEDAARRAAVKALAAKAALYAQATGLGTPRLISLSEGVDIAQPSRPAFMTMSKMSSDSGPTPIAEGELRVRIDVAGVYALGQ
jgi:uncharacterized protein YggE